MRRAPWWRGGRFREVSRRYPRDYESLPLWARFGFMIPMGALAFAAVVAVGCAALGGLALLFALQWYAMG